ncbi:MAG TPA: NAD(P)H-dependent oxidoreductase [Polyangia bacterium]|nr:NAD(P)H-dependent oxidoreductase [Polyangia bacterium]
MKLDVIFASTRDGRQGLPIAEWVTARARAHGAFEPELVDLRAVGLPLFDEPRHPRFRQYEHAHTKAWSAIVDAADAFVFVTPEYNYGMPPALLNAVDYLFHEWACKPAAIVSYGGISGGTRSAQMSKAILTSVKVMPLPEGISIPFFMTMISEGRFTPGEAQEKAAEPMLNELARWAAALGPMRK